MKPVLFEVFKLAMNDWKQSPDKIKEFLPNSSTGAVFGNYLNPTQCTSCDRSFCVKASTQWTLTIRSQNQEWKPLWCQTWFHDVKIRLHMAELSFLITKTSTCKRNFLLSTGLKVQNWSLLLRFCSIVPSLIGINQLLCAVKPHQHKAPFFWLLCASHARPPQPVDGLVPMGSKR